MLKRIAIILIIQAVSFGSLRSDIQFSMSDWFHYSSLKNITTISLDKSSRIWNGTPGGLFVYNEVTGESSVFNTINGMLNIEVSCLLFEPISGVTIVALADGTLELFDKELNITHITSIRDEKFPNPKINKMISNGAKIYIAGGFGIAVFDLEKKYFETSVMRIANWSRNLEITDLLFFDNKLWASSESGIAYCNLNSLLEVPHNWTSFSTESGLIQSNIKCLLAFENTLYAASENDVYRFDNNKFSIQHISANKINSIGAVNNQICISTDQKIYSINNDIIFDEQSNGFLFDVANKRLIIYTETGIRIISAYEGMKSIFPNSPKHNIFSRIGVDADGAIWSVSAHLNARFYPGGITHFKDGKWRNYSIKDYPELTSDSFFSLNILKNGKLYAGNWGAGLAIAETKSEDFDYTFLTANNSEFVGMNGSGFFLVGDCKMDNTGTVWCSNYASQTIGPMLVSIEPNGAQRGYANCMFPNERRILRLGVDIYGTKWLGSFPGEGRGIFYFNERGTPDITSDDNCGMISVSSHTALPDNSPTVIDTDRRGYVWLGFRQGLSVILNPSAVLSDGNLTIRSVRFMNNQSVNDILLDPVGLIWVATNTGVWILDKDATKVVYHISSKNSPLIDDNVLSIAANFNSGTIYLGTENGLFRFKSLSVMPNDYYDLVCYPQPFNLRRDEMMTIDGLTADSDIKIVTINGELVRTINAQGRKAIWDGRDESRRQVPSGVYLVIPYSPVSTTGSVQKIAVINR